MEDNSIKKILEVHKGLTELLQNIPPQELINAIEILEDSLINDIVRAVGFIISGKEDFIHIIRVNNDIYELIAGVSIFDKSCLEISIQLKDYREQEFKPENIQINGKYYGRLKSFQLGLSMNLRKFRKPIIEKILLLIKIYYSFLNTYIKNQITKLTNSFGNDLYTLIRRTFNALDTPKLTNFILFAVIDSVEKTGQYITDQTSSQFVFEKLEEDSTNLTESSAKLALSLFCTIQDFEAMFSKAAVESGDAIHIDLTKASYKVDQSTLYISERTLMPYDLLTILPLKREGRYLLVSWYPTKNAEKITKVLNQCKDEIAVIFSKERKIFKKMVQNTKKYYNNNELYNAIGSITGAFVKEWTK